VMSYIHQISLNWFVVYYFTLGIILLVNGLIWFSRPAPFQQYLCDHARRDERPALLIKTIRYLMLFSGASLMLALIPFSWVELIFSVWSLVVLFILGSILLRWKQLKNLILERPQAVLGQIRKGGYMMFSVGIVLLLLAWYRLSMFGFA
ncbi:MAG: hypothetical protein LAT75_08985, partial [Candidatus Cyclonatronum sp.]|uniref:hypothetical protein n=1 Tax=Cyclonatronum sp. TaxID=3024185 RepID=UPI0025B9D06A